MVRRWALCLAAGLICGGLGCTHQQTVPGAAGQRLTSSAQATITPPPTPAPPTDIEPDSDKTPITPKAKTCVALGAVRERWAMEKTRNTTERDQMYDLARRSYQQALEIDPHYLPAYLALAKLYEKIGDYERCQATYRRALQIQSRDGALWFEMGMCQARRKEWPSAVDSLKTAHELEPENRLYTKTLGLCLARAGRYDDSFDCLKRVVGDAEAHCDLARMLHHMNQDAASRQQLQVALQMNPQLESARFFQQELDGPPAARAPAAPAFPDTAPAATSAPPASAKPVASVAFESLD